ncbi:PTS sugar transporter subunit IIA [Anaerobranca gottschalkii]|uniref:PTS system, fructose-specific IIA component n=1 Tax=Anaerobranca gottschalkii DSM 13577 TaxID=1120990 RepID=A0A1I0CEA7_9FIRM|nr:fructose PTS transporter subunit IIA [Anaerobranca gottschalkii]SET17916.1 PTS system, fructose-specific IIA component [Anaerobranca gottschalkii DSM 13577]
MDLINEDLIITESELTDKKEIIIMMANLIKKNGRLSDLGTFVKEVLKRESLGSTAVGHGVGIPHGKTDAVKVPTIAFIKTKEYVKWGNDEDDLVNLIFMIAVPESVGSNEHLKILANLSKKLINDDFRNSLLITNDKEKINNILQSVFG